MSTTVRHPASEATPMDEVRHSLPCEITLGAHHLVLKDDQSIELMRAVQEASEPAYVLCLDATESYRLMQCLRDLFKQATHG